MSQHQGGSVAHGTYAKSENLGATIHNASLVLKGIDLLIADGISDGSTEKLRELLEIVWQLTSVTSSYVQEAYDVAGEISSALSGADQQ